jgi:hypothetical protein
VFWNRVLAQAGSAAANYQTGIGGFTNYTLQGAYRGIGSNAGQDVGYIGDTSLYTILGAWLQTDTAITGTGASGAGATANVILYNTAGVSVGTLFSLAFNTGINTVAFVPLTLGSVLTGVVGRSIPGGFLAKAGEGISFQWLQGATGLALPAASVIIDYV